MGDTRLTMVLLTAEFSAINLYVPFLVGFLVHFRLNSIAAAVGKRRLGFKEDVM